MKLSKKGKSRIHEMIDCAFEAHHDDAKGVQVLAKKYLTECDDFELEPDDFKDVVVLTVEEAKDVLHSLNCAWSRCPVKAECKDLVKKKIKQAEDNYEAE